MDIEIFLVGIKSNFLFNVSCLQETKLQTKHSLTAFYDQINSILFPHAPISNVCLHLCRGRHGANILFGKPKPDNLKSERPILSSRKPPKMLERGKIRFWGVRNACQRRPRVLPFVQLLIQAAHTQSEQSVEIYFVKKKFETHATEFCTRPHERGVCFPQNYEWIIFLCCPCSDWPWPTDSTQT